MIWDNYYMKGCMSGMFGIVLSHPVDSIKTFYQTSKMNKLELSTTKPSFKYNFTNLYRGITSPLLGVGLEKALVFGTYNYFFNNMNCSTELSGAISGLTAAIIVSPYERIKIMKQTNQVVTSAMYMSPTFLFKGLSATFTREVPGFAIYFSTYEALKKHFYTDFNKDITIPASFIFGGMSGTMAWIFIYPQDRIKTLLQSSENKDIKTIITDIYTAGGLRYFYKGFSLAVIRAILLHSGTFCMMEYLNKNKSFY